MQNDTQATLLALRDGLAGQIAAIQAVAMPLREARDAFVQDARAQEAAMNDAIREAESGLFDLQNELSTIAKALGGARLSDGADETE